MRNERPGPRLRRDLVCRPLRRAGRRLIEIYDPVSCRSWRLSETGYSIAWMMDGRDLAALADRVWADLHVEVEIEDLARFAAHLHERGCLEDDSVLTLGDTVNEAGQPTEAMDRETVAALLARMVA